MEGLEIMLTVLKQDGLNGCALQSETFEGMDDFIICSASTSTVKTGRHEP